MLMIRAVAVSSTATTPTFDMRVSMFEFFNGGKANLAHIHIKVEVLIRQRMIAVDGDFIVFDFDNTHSDHSAFLCASVELHACLHLSIHALEAIHRDHLHHFWTTDTVTLFGCDPDLHVVPAFATLQCLFEAGDDIAIALHVHKGTSAVRLIYKVSCIVREDIVNGNHGAFTDIHSIVVLGVRSLSRVSMLYSIHCCGQSTIVRFAALFRPTVKKWVDPMPSWLWL